MKYSKCFIFGSNSTGFHGAGAAGFAFRGDSKNNWRDCPIMKAAMAHGRGYRGVLAEFGKAKGYQEGTKGCSYAIVTVTKPGAKRSIPLNEIESQVEKLIEFMRKYPEITFCLSRFGAAYAGYTEEEMTPLWERILNEPNSRWANIK